MICNTYYITFLRPKKVVGDFVQIKNKKGRQLNHDTYLKNTEWFKYTTLG